MEAVLQKHESVLEAATIGVLDDIKGVAPVCFVILHPGSLESDDIKSELLDLIGVHLGKAMHSKSIYFVAELPKTKNGKVLRRAIRAAYLNLESGDLSSMENPDTLEQIRNLTVLNN